jgi:hypothetical protein
MNLYEHLIQNYFNHSKNEKEYEELNLWTSIEKRVDQIFFTNGNGLEWEDGVIIDCSKLKENQTPREWIESLKGRNEQRREAHNPYPLCEYSLFCTIPDDVEDSFLFGAWEAYQRFDMTEIEWAWKPVKRFYEQRKLGVSQEIYDDFTREFYENKGYISCEAKHLYARFEDKLKGMQYWTDKQRKALAKEYEQELKTAQ